MTAIPSQLTHPVSGAVVAIRERLAELVDVPLFSMSPEETARTLAELARLTASLAELELRVAAHADTVEVGMAVGAGSTADWWARESRRDHGTAARRIELAHALDHDDRSRVRAALAAGEITEEAAHIIVGALDALPDGLDEVTLRQAEQVMIDNAQELGPRRLRVTGKALLAVVAPALGDARDEQVLAAEAHAAQQAMRLFMWDDGRGTTIGEFALPTLYAAMLKKMLMAFAAPKHQRAEATKRRHASEAPDAGDPAEEEEVPPWRRPGPERMGQALAELIERFAGGDLPEAGGVPATVVVTMTLDQLRGRPGAVQLDTGHRISAGQARRLACQAGIIPLVLGGRSVPLDVGRRRRFHGRYQRLVIHHRDRTCTITGCDVPGWRCHVHHDRPWSRGGHTTVEDGRLLCPRHHHLVHDPTYEVTPRPDGRIDLHRRS